MVKYEEKKTHSGRQHAFTPFIFDTDDFLAIETLMHINITMIFF